MSLHCGDLVGDVSTRRMAEEARQSWLRHGGEGKGELGSPLCS